MVHVCVAGLAGTWQHVIGAAQRAPAQATPWAPGSPPSAAPASELGTELDPLAVGVDDPLLAPGLVVADVTSLVVAALAEASVLLEARPGVDAEVTELCPHATTPPSASSSHDPRRASDRQAAIVSCLVVAGAPGAKQRKRMGFTGAQ